ncbi:hypothetical protein FB451DRAFT_1195084 [Mycena latifolia]|nr:hypothetical protein FB451DRAFT_1195084 [Mycena latifolia]
MSAYKFRGWVPPDGADGGAVGSAGGAVGMGTVGPGADDAVAGMLAGIWATKMTWGRGVELGDYAAGTGAGFDLDKVVASGLTSGFVVIADMQPPSSSAGQFEVRPAALLYPSGDCMGPSFLHLRAGGAKALQAPSTPPAPPAPSSGEPSLLPKCKRRSHWRACSKEMEGRQEEERERVRPVQIFGPPSPQPPPLGPSLTRNRSFMGRCAKHLVVANHPFANQGSVHKCSATPQFPVELGKGREVSEVALEVLEVVSFLKLFSFF